METSLHFLDRNVLQLQTGALCTRDMEPSEMPAGSPEKRVLC